MAKLTFEEVQEKLDDLGIKLFDNEEWDCYDIYPQYTMRGLGSTEHTTDRSEESLKEAYKKGLQMAKKAGKFSKITFDQSKIIAKRITKPVKRKLSRKNPDKKGMYPFLFFLPKDYKAGGTTEVSRDTWIVKIALFFDYVLYDSSWMMDDELGKKCLQPDVDLTEKSYKFYSEKEALKFIRDWWCK